ncbi:MAG: aldo/keto reductase [Bacteroidia bacterium]|nr:aldo/keto reductase [Bacteroidia bacterium]
MEKRQLGRSDLYVSPLTFGGNVFGWTADEKTSFELLDGFIAAGFNFIDTADVYSAWAPGNKGGESETIIGRWLKSRGNRDKVIIATKVGWDFGDGRKGLAPAYIRRAVEDSLNRLQTDHIDLYQSHVDDENVPREEVLQTYAELIKEGKVRWIGASNIKAERLASALEISAKNGLPRYESLQPQYNLYDRAGFETALEKVCTENDLGVIGYYALASGFLSGKYRTESDLSQSARGGGVKKYLDARGMRILDALDRTAAETGSTPATVALAWLIQRPSVTAPIVSATSTDQLQSLVKAPELTLSAEAVQRLNEASAL